MSRPFVSCICPTYNRREFLPHLLYMYDYQTYPADRRELVILDDSPTSNEDIINALPIDKKKNIIYKWLPEKVPLGQKRNMINEMAKGEYIVCMDDDDYHPPERIAHAITRLASCKALVGGSSKIYVYYTHLGKTVSYGPFGPGHATNGTMAYHRDYLKTHSYENEATHAEERHFLDEFSKTIAQFDPLKTLLCIAHGRNTWDKNKNLPQAKTYDVPLKKIVKDKRMLEFYNELTKKASNAN